MTPRLASLSEVEARAWQELARAAGDKQHEWRTPVLATVNAETVDARTVILREVDVHRRQLTFFTDERAGKVAQLQRNPLAAMVMWSANLGWQLRCRIVLSIETPGLAATSRWARIRLTPAAQDYLWPLAPGTPLNDSQDTPQAPELPARKPTYFTVVTAQVLSILRGLRRPRGTSTRLPQSRS